MHLQVLVALVILSFVRRIDAELATGTTSIVWDFGGGHFASETSTSATKFLRSSGINDDDDSEERVGLSAVQKLKNLLSSPAAPATPQQLEAWLAKGKSAKDVFGRLQLTEGEGYLLLRPQFTEWLKYVEKLNAKNPTKGTSATSTLTAYYGETGLYRLIEAGIKNRNTEDLATKLQAEQIQHWVAKAKGPYDVFRIMALNVVHKNTILSNPGFSTWAKYVDAFNAKNPEHPTSMIPTLLNYFSDVALFKLTEAAQNVKGTKSIATKLQEQLVQVWLIDRIILGPIG